MIFESVVFLGGSLLFLIGSVLIAAAYSVEGSGLSRVAYLVRLREVKDV